MPNRKPISLCMDPNYFKFKKAWMKTLKVGDLVEDCKYTTQKIKSLRRVFIRVYALRSLALTVGQCYWLETHLPLLNKIYEWIEDNIIYGIGCYEIWNDNDMILEDGLHCSAIHCCDPICAAWSPSDDARTTV